MCLLAFQAIQGCQDFSLTKSDQDYNCLQFIIIPSVIECACDAEENAKREFAR